MRLMERLRLDRLDIRVLLGLIVVDLALTTVGIHHFGGGELSPLFQPFISSLGLTLLGAGIYLGIVLGLNRLIREGPLRAVLLSTAVGMHAAGVLSWVTGLLYPSLGIRMGTVYGYFVFIALATAASYWYLYDRDRAA